MTIKDISFRHTNLFSNLILDYMSLHDKVKDFYHYPPTSDAIETIIEDKKRESIDRIVLADTVLRQYAGYSISTVVTEHIESLRNENTFCIVTAHQLNIFTGPLYYIYKIAQTISACRQLKEKYTTYNFIPVYWMGSEDHDFEEINHIHLFNKKIEWENKQGGATGDYNTASLLPLVDELERLLGSAQYTDVLSEHFRKAYLHKDLSKATRYLVDVLFGQYGLLVIDGNDKTLKRIFSDVMKDELLNRHSYKLVKEQLSKLEAKGYKQQATPRELNLFYLSKHSRERIEWEESSATYKVVNTSVRFTKEEIEKELENYPERFSPNVILRPLYQQKVLPSLAYIGGGGEVAYWLQLKPVFEYYNINYPQLLVRNSALLINGHTLKKIEKLDFSLLDFFKDLETLRKEYIAAHTEENIDVTVYKSAISGEFEKLKELAKNIDASLVNTVGAEMQKSLQSIDAIEKRLMKSLKQKNETALNQIEKLKGQLFPDNSLQERKENFSVYYNTQGQEFIENLISEFDVYHKQFLIFQYS